MGQYHKVVNVDKNEYIDSHAIDNGLKLVEQFGFDRSTSSAVWLLLAASNGRGGGDVKPHPMVGHWAGDRIIVIGDYAETGDHPDMDLAHIYNSLSTEYTDISDKINDMFSVCLD